MYAEHASAAMPTAAMSTIMAGRLPAADGQALAMPPMHVSFAPSLTSTLGRRPPQLGAAQQQQYCMGVVGDPSQYYYG